MRMPDWEAEAERRIRHDRGEQNLEPEMRVASRENAVPGPGVRYRVHSVASPTGQTEAEETAVVAAAIVVAGAVAAAGVAAAVGVVVAGVVVVAAAAGVVVVVAAAAAGVVVVVVAAAAATTKAVAPVRHRIELA